MDWLEQEWVLVWHSVSWINRSTSVSDRMWGCSVGCQRVAAILRNILTQRTDGSQPPQHCQATFPPFFLLKRHLPKGRRRKMNRTGTAVFSVWEVYTLAAKEGNSKHLFPLALFLVQERPGNRPHTWQASQSNSLATRNASASVNGSSGPHLR